MGAQPLRADQLGRRRVLGDLGAERLDAAARSKRLATPQHRLALSESVADALARILPARLIGVEEGALDLGGEGLPAREPIGGAHTMPVSERQRASSRWM